MGRPRLLRVGMAALLAATRPGQAASRDLAIPSHGFVLAASFVAPEGPGPFPAVVLLAGSGPETRSDLKPMATQLVARGWAALIYDKRGSGFSTGDWTATSLSDLADDAVAALATLASQREVDRRHIGLWGNSQSGWIAPMAANRSDLSMFVVVTTGGGATPKQVERFGYEQSLSDARLTPEQLAAAHAALETYFQYLATGEGRAQLKTDLMAAGNKPWANALGLARVLPTEGSRRAWQWVANYDPAADIARLRIPTFVLLAGADDESPLADALLGWSKSLAAAGDPRSRILLVPAAGHGMTIGGHHERLADNVYAPGVFDAVVSWERLVASGSAPAR
jgi:esterase/lipase